MMGLGSSVPLPNIVLKHADNLICPACGFSLTIDANLGNLRCKSCKKLFVTSNGVPLMFEANAWGDQEDVTEEVRNFYEKTPFPGYEGVETKETLVEKAKRGFLAEMLSAQISDDAMVLEVGCGTGQMSNFLSLKEGRSVFATDICLNSLSLAQKFKQKNRLERVAFLQMNLFKPVFKPEAFDLVFCNGVLHHTSDPFLGFQTLTKLVKKNGYLIIGLYNKWGRILTKILQFILRGLPLKCFESLDLFLGEKTRGFDKRNAWFRDQYRHPHESTHTFGEVLKWFDREGIEFINSIPSAVAFEGFNANAKLFTPHSRGNRFDHFITQAGMLLKGGPEGGFFLMIGRRKT